MLCSRESIYLPIRQSSPWGRWPQRSVRSQRCGSSPEILTDGATIARRLLGVPDRYTHMGSLLVFAGRASMPQTMGGTPGGGEATPWPRDASLSSTPWTSPRCWHRAQMLRQTLVNTVSTAIAYLPQQIHLETRTELTRVCILVQAVVQRESTFHQCAGRHCAKERDCPRRQGSPGAASGPAARGPADRLFRDV